MYEFFANFLSLLNFQIALSVFGAALLAYTFATVLSSWMIGAALFPGLTLGSLAAIELAKHFGLVVGRDKEIPIMGACAIGLIATLFAYYILFNILNWLISHNRRAHRELIERAGDHR